MAKYTELLAEYLEGGGALPSSSFALIPDFEDLFKERFCGSEIGFETEALFAIKLDMKARVVMPLYAARVAAVDAAVARLQTPVKQRTEQRGYGKQHSENTTDGSNTDLPYDYVEGGVNPLPTPSSLSHLGGSADVDYHEDNLKFVDYVTIDENIKIIETLSEKRSGIIEKCLDEFKPLFMGVY